MLTRVASFLITATVLAACGDNRGHLVTTLDDEAISAECSVLVDMMPPREMDCGHGTSRTIGRTHDSCVREFRKIQGVTSCSATVDDVDSCVEEVMSMTDSQLCRVTAPKNCRSLRGCGNIL